MVKFKVRRTTIYETLSRKLHIQQPISHYNRLELRCAASLSISCSTSDAHRVTLVANLVISHYDKKNISVVIYDPGITWRLTSHGGDGNIFEVMNTTHSEQF
jgi:hypothetical protein